MRVKAMLRKRGGGPVPPVDSISKPRVLSTPSSATPALGGTPDTLGRRARRVVSHAGASYAHNIVSYVVTWGDSGFYETPSSELLGLDILSAARTGACGASDIRCLLPTLSPTAGDKGGRPRYRTMTVTRAIKLCSLTSPD